MIEFKIEGDPCVKQRPRFTKVGSFVRTYNSPANVEYENWVKLCYKEVYGDKIFKENESLCITIEAYFKVPSTFSKKKTQQALSDEVRPANSKDVDNIAKIVLDGLNGVAFADDRYITSLIVKKRYSETPYVKVTIDYDK